MSLRPPIEATATLLTISTLLLGDPTLNLPTWGIFLGWAATSLCGRPTKATIGAIGPALLVGGFFALLTLLLREALLTHSALNVPAWGATLIALTVINPLMLLLGRLKALSLVPGMFIGFSTVLATYFGGFGPGPENVLSAFIYGTTMNVLGIGFSWAAVTLSRAPQNKTATCPANFVLLQSTPRN